MVTTWCWYSVLCVAVALIVRYHWNRRKLYSLANSLQGPPALPFIGNGLMFACKDEDLFENASKLISSYPSPVPVWLGPKLILVLQTAEELEKALTSPEASDKDDIYKILDVFNGNSLFSTNGSLWKKHRRFVRPFLAPNYVESYFRIVKENSDELVKKFGKHSDGASLLIEHYISQFYTDIVVEMLLGFKPYAQQGKMDDLVERVHSAYILLHARMLRVWLHPDCLFRLSANGKEQLETRDIFTTFLHKAFDTIKLKDKSKDELEFTSIFENMMDRKKKTPSSCTDQEIEDHIRTLYSTSEDTLTSTTGFLLMMLAMHPHVQDKVLHEIESILGRETANLQYKDLGQMKYLDMCLKETLRLFPIGPFIVRKVNDDFNLGGRIVPKGTTLALNIFTVHRSPVHWEKPNKFYPEHFSPECTSKRHPYAFLPFSAGSRSCPGQFLSFVAIKTAVVMLLQHYVLEADGTVQTMRIKADISIRPRNPHAIRIKNRIW